MAFCRDSMPTFNHDRDISATTNVFARSGQITSVITIAERLKSAREAAELSQDELAKKAGVSQGTIANVEGGVRKNPRELLAIARAVGVNPEWLKSGKGPKLAEPNNSNHSAQEQSPGYAISRNTKHDLAYHIAQIGALLVGVDEVRRAAIAEMLSAVAKKPEQAEEIGTHIQTLAGSKAKRAA